jgi:hypothetical protein
VTRNLAERLKELEQRINPSQELIALHWPGTDYVEVLGEKIPLADWQRLHPGEETIQLKWRSGAATNDGEHAETT